MDNKIAVISLDNGGFRSQEFLKISKSISHYLLSHGIMITAEYLPRKLNVKVYLEFWNVMDS